MKAYDPDSFPTWLERACLAVGYRPGQVSKAAGVDSLTGKKIIQRRRTPQQGTMQKLRDALVRLGYKGAEPKTLTVGWIEEQPNLTRLT